MGDEVAIRVCTVKPRRGGYKHRDIIVVVDGVGLTENGEVIEDLIDFAMRKDSHIFMVSDPAHLLNTMLKSHAPDFNYQLVDSRESDVPAGCATMSNPRLTRFGWNKTGGRGRSTMKGKRKGKGMHIVWSIMDMMRDPTNVLGTGTPGDMLHFAKDVRDWCKEYNLPLPTALSGIASSLLRDERFYPEARGRVPRATNERVRPFLPGVYSELRAKPYRTIPAAVSLDQRRAYHKAAQAVPLPDPNTLFARGYFQVPDDAPLWCGKGDMVYNRTVDQPGLVLARATSRITHKHETRPPAINYTGTRDVYLWTNEINLCETTGLQIEGLIAAWTSTNKDHGLARYGAWAEEAIDNASPYRSKWLKPTLHAAYGLLGARARDLHIAHRLGRAAAALYLIGGHSFPVHETVLPNTAPPTTNVPALGVLQAEIRASTMKLANDLIMEGVDVLHVHADGIHVNGKLPLLNLDDWSIEPRTNLHYLDRVSWLADEGDTLPGRDQQQRLATRRESNAINNR